MKNSIQHIVLLAVLCLSRLGCSQQTQPLQEGDLLFQDLDCGALCDAIEAVTEGVSGKDFSHCGMVIKIGDSLKVIEAIGEQVQVNSIAIFLARSGDTETLKNTTVARVKPSHKALIDKAATYAIQQIGQPYDHEFLLNNGSWYCSELLYEAFKHANDNKAFFQLSPMTYKDPKTKAFFPAWVDYYAALNKDIPEGKPGLNPGSISRSNAIEIIALNHIK